MLEGSSRRSWRVFVQVIQGRVRDQQAARQLLERWRLEIGPAAEGLLGATAGVTDDGWLVHIARFRGQGDAGRHSERPEQRAWWDDLRQLLDEPVIHHDCTDVALVAGGGDDASALVQVVQKRTEPGQRLLHGAISALEEALERHRPDVLGAMLACAEDGVVTQVVYLAGGAELLAAETAPAGEEAAALLGQLGAEPGSDDLLLELHSPMLMTTGSPARDGP
jgi:hypothetical protein